MSREKEKKVYERILDDLGRLVIPKHLHKKMGLEKGQLLEITLEYGVICVKAFDPSNIKERPFIGAVREMGELGRIVIPAEYRQILKFMPGSQVQIYLEGDTLKIILKIYL